jgi:hypothetical protein
MAIAPNTTLIALLLKFLDTVEPLPAVEGATAAFHRSVDLISSPLDPLTSPSRW